MPMGSAGVNRGVARSFTLRPLLVWSHRVLGLSTALFLFIAGLTGSVLAFNQELDEWLNPAVYRATAEGMPLPAEELARRVEAGHPDRSVWYMDLPREPGRAARVGATGRPDPVTGIPVELDKNWFSVDPVSGEILSARLWGECCFSRERLIPFLYEFHHNLSLPGEYGVVFMGLVAVLWVIDSVVGLALTFPRGRPFFAKWRAAFGVKGGSSFRLNLDLHRAAGLWLFVVLLLVAVSSVAMNLRYEVLEPVVSLFSRLTPGPFSGPPGEKASPRVLSFDTMLETAREDARARGWNEPPHEVFYSPHYNTFGASFGDHDAALGLRWLYFDGVTAKPTGSMIPGVGTAGDIFLQMQLPIHGGRILGLPGRILIAITGVAIAGLSVTGVVIWWKKRAGRVGRARKAKAGAATTGRTGRGLLSRGG